MRCEKGDEKKGKDAQQRKAAGDAGPHDKVQSEKVVTIAVVVPLCSSTAAAAAAVLTQTVHEPHQSTAHSAHHTQLKEGRQSKHFLTLARRTDTNDSNGETSAARPGINRGGCSRTIPFTNLLHGGGDISPAVVCESYSCSAVKGCRRCSAAGVHEDSIWAHGWR